MGLFERNKSSVDYLREISRESKKQTQAAQMAADAEQQKAYAIVEAARERTRAAICLKDREERAVLARRINELEFDPANPNGMVSNLSYLCSLVEGWLHSYASERGHRTLCKAAESKLKIGLKLLSIADPSNSMIPYFNGMMDEFQAQRAKIRKRTIIIYSIPWAVFLLVVLGVVIWGIITDWDENVLVGFVWAVIFLVVTALVQIFHRPPLDRDKTEAD